MSNLFKFLKHNEDDEIDVNFDLSELEVPEKSNVSPPLHLKKNKALAVWGNPSSGKTIVSVKLARYLASLKKNTCIVLCDMTTPLLPFICPSSDFYCEYSFGNMLAAVHGVDKETLNNLHMMCVDEVKKINGIITYEKAVRFQKE